MKLYTQVLLVLAMVMLSLGCVSQTNMLHNNVNQSAQITMDIGTTGNGLMIQYDKNSNKCLVLTVAHLSSSDVLFMLMYQKYMEGASETELGKYVLKLDTKQAKGGFLNGKLIVTKDLSFPARVVSIDFEKDLMLMEVSLPDYYRYRIFQDVVVSESHAPPIGSEIYTVIIRPLLHQLQVCPNAFRHL